jgi:16S rRNA (adenine1518-N6/adenine1519-N6)-dimethyltransferase
LQTLTEIRELLASRGLRPRHRFGQNFLHDQNQLRKLIEAAAIKPGEVVLEVGPGTGTLTEALLDAGAEVIACEIDRDLAELLRERLGERITLIEGDCLESQRVLHPAIIEALGGRSLKLVANLPYNVASPLITTLLIDHYQCSGQFVTIQREVADRLLAKPSTKEYGPLSIIVQALATVERIAVLKPSCFWPEPEVTSAMVAIHPFATSEGRKGAGAEGTALSGADARRAFARFVTELFSSRRKQLGRIFGRERDWVSLRDHGITPDLRPDALSVDQLIALQRFIG